MKRTIAFLLLLLCTLPISAQEYIAYTVHGEVTLRTRGKSSQLTPGDKLGEGSVLSIGTNSKITILNEGNNKIVTIKTPGTGTISSFITKAESKTSNVSTDYIAFIKKKIASGGNGKDVNYMQSAGTSYRGVKKQYSPLPNAENGKLLEPLRAICKKAIDSFVNSDIYGLSEASQALESLGICRYNFDLASAYTPTSFNGHLVLDPLCLFDLVASLDAGKPFVSQLCDLPVPISPTTTNTNVEGNILANYYKIDSGAEVTINIDCVGYCEIAVISINNGIVTKFNGQDTNYLYFKDVVAGKINIKNTSLDPAVVMFFINAE